MNPILALIIANVIWGAASPLFKFALENIPPFTLAFIRFFFAALIFLPLSLQGWRKMKGVTLIELCFLGLFGITINVSFFFFGLRLSESINAPIIASTGPVFLYIFSIILLKERPKIMVLFGLLTSLLGVFLIIFTPIFIGGQKLALGKVEGNIFFLIATLGGVFSALVGKNVLKKVGSSQAAFISFLFSSLTFLPFIFGELNRWSFAQMDIRSWTGIIFGVFFSSGLAYYMYYYGISKIKAQEVGIFTYIDPIAAIIIAIPLLHEYPDIYFILGSILVFGGIYIAEGRFHWHPIHRLKKNIK